ncbi:proline hydroxylase [Streptomyces chattanoogensis]|uniref:proline hydroxylase n=1 Tax=Streptomyces chattanoogensis TaxID=66876 RepID=UPI0036A27968
MTTTALDLLFTLVEARAFTDRDIAALAAGTTGAVRIPGFLAAADCACAVEAIENLPVVTYAPERVTVKISRFGPALNDYRAPKGGVDADRYWQATDESRAIWTRSGLRPDPLAVSLECLGRAWGAAISPATIGGRAAFGGTLREINEGALIHFDEVVREHPKALFDQTIMAQLAFNVWITVPSSGGKTRLWRRRWHPTDEAHREAYGYRPDVVDGHQELRLPPRLGEALLFNPANFHAVEPNPGDRRVAFAFFLGLPSTGHLAYWS